MVRIEGHALHLSRCKRVQNIDWSQPASTSNVNSKSELGDVILKVDKLKKYYEVAANELFGSVGEKRVVKANESILFEARKGETLAIVGEFGCDKSTFAKILMDLETATDGQILLDGNNIQQTAIEDRNTQTVVDI